MTRTDAVYAAATTRCTTRSSPSADRADHSREAAANPPPAPDTPDSCGPSAATALAPSSEDDTIYEDEDGFGDDDDDDEDEDDESADASEWARRQWERVAAAAAAATAGTGTGVGGAKKPPGSKKPPAASAAARGESITPTDPDVPTDSDARLVQSHGDASDAEKAEDVAASLVRLLKGDEARSPAAERKGLRVIVRRLPPQAGICARLLRQIPERFPRMRTTPEIPSR